MSTNVSLPRPMVWGGSRLALLMETIETTRIYLISTGAEHARQLDRLGLVE